MSLNIYLFQFQHHVTHGKVAQRQEKYDSFMKFDVNQDLAFLDSIDSYGSV